MENIKQFEEEMDWFLGRLNFGVSPLDARAIRFMNEWRSFIRKKS